MNDDDKCQHPNIVPIGTYWARCTACGDSTFPLWDPQFDDGAPDPLVVERLRSHRLRRWTIALAAALVASVASHACDNIRHRHRAEATRWCVENPL